MGDFENAAVELGPEQGFFVPRGNKMHVFDRTRARLCFTPAYFAPATGPVRLPNEPRRLTERIRQLRAEETATFGQHRVGEVRRLGEEFDDKMKEVADRDAAEQQAKLDAMRNGRMRWWHTRDAAEDMDNLKTLKFQNTTLSPETLITAQDIVILNLTGCGIGDASMSFVTTFLVQNAGTLRRLSLQGNKLTLAGIEELAPGLRSASTLTDIDVSLNPIRDDGLARIVGAFNENLRSTKISKLNVSSCGLTSAAGYHLARFMRDVRTVNIVLAWRNNIGLSDPSLTSVGVGIIFEELATNRNMKHIDLSANCINEEQAARHAETLEQVARQRRLDKIATHRRKQNIDRMTQEVEEKRRTAVWEDEKIELAGMERELAVEVAKHQAQVEEEENERRFGRDNEFRDRVAELTGRELVDVNAVKRKIRVVLQGNHSVTHTTMRRLAQFYDVSTAPDYEAWAFQPRKYDQLIQPRRQVGDVFDIDEDQATRPAAENIFPFEDEMHRRMVERHQRRMEELRTGKPAASASPVDVSVPHEGPEASPEVEAFGSNDGFAADDGFAAPGSDPYAPVASPFGGGDAPPPRSNATKRSQIRKGRSRAAAGVGRSVHGTSFEGGTNSSSPTHANGSADAPEVVAADPFGGQSESPRNQARPPVQDESSEEDEVDLLADVNLEEYLMDVSAGEADRLQSRLAPPEATMEDELRAKERTLRQQVADRAKQVRASDEDALKETIATAEKDQGIVVTVSAETGQINVGDTINDGNEPDPEEVARAVLFASIAKAREFWAEMKRLGSGSPGEAALSELEDVRHRSLMLLRDFASHLSTDGEMIEAEGDEVEALFNFFEELAQQPEDPATAQLMVAYIDRVGIDFSNLIDSRGIATLCAVEDKRDYLKEILAIEDIEFDFAELVRACFENVLARVPLVNFILASKVVPWADIGSDIDAQSFFVDVASRRRAIEGEDRNDRLEVLGQLLAHPNLTVDPTATGDDGYDVFTRACAEGDGDLVQLLIDAGRVSSPAWLRGTDGIGIIDAAVIGGHPEILRAILSHDSLSRAPVNNESQHGTPLDLAMLLRRDAAVIDLLREHGAEPSAARLEDAKKRALTAVKKTRGRRH